MTAMCEYLMVTSSFHLFSYKHLALLDIQRSHSPVAMRNTRGTVCSRRESTTQCAVWYQGGLKNSEERSSQCELLLYAPQSLGALNQLLLLVGLQCHVNDIRQATAAQDTRDAQEDVILHSMHALPQRERDDTEKTGFSGEVIISAACTVCFVN